MYIRGRENWVVDMHAPSIIVASVGFIVLLFLPRFPFETLKDFVTARGPEPPAAAGLPTPNLVCSFAFLVRVAGGVGSG